MLNPFPIQWLALLAYLLLRVALGMVLLLLARGQLRDTQSPLQKRTILLLVSEALIGGLLILGAYTQYAAIATVVISLILGGGRRLAGTTRVDPLLLGMMSAAAVCLFVTGAGALAFDLPL